MVRVNNYLEKVNLSMFQFENLKGLNLLERGKYKYEILLPIKVHFW